MEREINGTLIVRRIDNILIEKSLKRADVVRACGLKSNTMTNWLQRGTIPNADEALKIASFLNVSVNWLVYGVEDGFTSEELELIGKWRLLTEHDKQVISNLFASFLSATQLQNTSS